MKMRYQMMKAIVITNKGAEEIAAAEIKDLINSKPHIQETALSFEADSLETISHVCYMAQSLKKVMLLLDEFSFSSDKDIISKAKNLSFEEINTKTFAVRCERHGEHPFSSQDLEAEIGAVVFKKRKLKVSLDNPEAVLFLYIYDDHCYIGLDMCGFDLSKRQYKIFTASSAIKGTTAYILCRFAEPDPKHVILDPFCSTSTIPIELALFFSGFSVNYFNKDKFLFNNMLKFDFTSLDKKAKFEKFNIIGYDSQLRHVKASQKNAKIAGVDKLLSISKLDAEWLDTKHDKKSIDRIISFPPHPTKTFSVSEAKKLMKEFFYQAEFILKDDGKIVLLTLSKDLFLEAASKEKFKLESSHKIWQGQQEFDVIILAKNPKPL